MYVKLFTQILEGSMAPHRRLRHFFMDMLLCADRDGNVMMTKEALGHRIRADAEEVEWGIAELMKPDGLSNHGEYEGRRIIPLEGHGYGWKIVNYGIYRDMKSDAERRAETAERVRRHREKKALMKSRPLNGEAENERKIKAGLVDDVTGEPVAAKKVSDWADAPLSATEEST